MSGQSVRLTSGTLHVESNGDPGGRLLLCVHGLSANCRSFDRFVPALTDLGGHVVTMDLRGRGHSETTAPGSYGWDSHVRDLVELADFYGAESFDVLGHSMGAFIGMTLAAAYPQRCGRLVLLDALGVPEPSSLVPISRSVSRLGQTYPSVDAVLDYVRSGGTIVWDEFWDNYFAWELEPVGDAVRIRTDLGAVTEDAIYATNQDIYEVWPRLRCPVLVVRATTSMATEGGLIIAQADAERFGASADDRRVIDVDADHYSILTSATVIDAVVQFIGSAAAG